MKQYDDFLEHTIRVGRPFAGAWIETFSEDVDTSGSRVAPSRGRGLKHDSSPEETPCLSRPFAGAWIETAHKAEAAPWSSSRPFAGAWIETFTTMTSLTLTWVAPSRGRGLKPSLPWSCSFGLGKGRPFAGAWIETRGPCRCCHREDVAPSRGRGLKLHAQGTAQARGCRPFAGAWIETQSSFTRANSRRSRPFAGAWIET